MMMKKQSTKKRNNASNKKAQLSVEHLVIVGLSLMVIIPSTLLLFNFAKNTSDLTQSMQIKSIGETINYYARDMYLKGPDNMVSITVVLPDSAANMSIVSGDEIVIVYRTINGPSEAVFFADYPLIGALGNSDEIIVDRPGIVNLIINSTESGVMVRER